MCYYCFDLLFCRKYHYEAMDNQNIFKRPNSSDSEADLIKFQNLFLAEKTKNTNFQPAAKVIRLTEPGNEIAFFKPVMI